MSHSDDPLRVKLGCSIYGFRLRFAKIADLTEGFYNGREWIAYNTIAATFAAHRGSLARLLSSPFEKLFALDEHITRVELEFDDHESLLPWRTFFSKDRICENTPAEVVDWNILASSVGIDRGKPGYPTTRPLFPEVSSNVEDRSHQHEDDFFSGMPFTVRKTTSEPVFEPVQGVMLRLESIIREAAFAKRGSPSAALLSSFHNSISNLKLCSPLILRRFQTTLRYKNQPHGGRVVATLVQHWQEPTASLNQPTESVLMQVEGAQDSSNRSERPQPPQSPHEEDQRSETQTTEVSIESCRISSVNVLAGTLVYIALGSNLGDRLAWIEMACRETEKQGDIRILRTSGLWETQAMYVTDQANFLNGVCEVSGSYPVLYSVRRRKLLSKH